jgi:hypothetical protein
VTKHWHAYSYTGRSFSDGEIRGKKAPEDYPPIEIKHWLMRPKRHIIDTFTEIDPAIAWLEGELTNNLPLDEESFPVKLRLEYCRDRLKQTAGNDVVYGFYSKAGQYVSRALIACRPTDPWEEFFGCPIA